MLLPLYSYAGFRLLTIDSNSIDYIGYYNTIAIDSNNKIHITYYDTTNQDLKYITNVSGLWVTTILDSIGNVGLYSSIAIDHNDKIHIGYMDFITLSSKGAFKYATNVSGSWVYLYVQLWIIQVMLEKAFL